MLLKLKIIIAICVCSISISCWARDFKYTYEGHTLDYTVIDEEAKTCATKAGIYESEMNAKYSGNDAKGMLTIPDVANDGRYDYQVVEIGDYGFYYCPLTDVRLPKSLMTIGKEAFFMTHLQTVDFPSALIEIKDQAFLGTELVEVSFPDSLKAIGHDVFDGLLTSIEVKAIVPPSIESDSFNGYTYATAWVKVPAESEEAYMTSSNWSKFVNYPSVVANPDGYFLIGDFNGWQLPEGPDYHDAIRMKCLEPTTDGIGAAEVYIVRDIDFNRLGKFVVYSPDSTYIGFDPSINPSTYESNGTTSTDCRFRYGHSLEKVVPFQLDETVGENVSFEIVMSVIGIRITNAILASELLDMVGVDKIRSGDLIEVARYTPAGVPVNADYKGLVIVRYADGSSRKVMEK